MKKYILLLLTLSMLILTGCKETQKTSTPDTSDDTEVTASSNESEKETEKIRHEISDSIDTDGYILIDEISYDFDSDGEDDLLELFSTVAYKDDEKFHHDDGASWLITVTTQEGVFKLFDQYIQLGYPQIDVGEFYNDDVTKVIILTQTTGAGKSISHYAYEDDGFSEELIYSTDNFTESGASIVETIY